MRYCDTDGWNDELNKNLCGEVVVQGGPATAESVEEPGSGMVWLLVIVNACAFVLICSICFLICDRYRRKKARVKVVAMPDNAKMRGKKPATRTGGEARKSTKEGAANTKPKPKAVAEISVKGKGDAAKKKPAVDNTQLFE
eukprot:TRINITY_DN1244_c0_g1_i1.p2 TRINITY_DN1244_c0_g1~~TRINITY_DN1244_c0_g1_i1.p2  ORF type:complete len:141 (+),score=24.65 TRINITY_DN1244_c0_g1_i1:423-845(+)